MTSMNMTTTIYSKHYKPTLYFGLVTMVTLVSLTVFHFSHLIIVFEKPKIDPLYQFPQLRKRYGMDSALANDNANLLQMAAVINRVQSNHVLRDPNGSAVLLKMPNNAQQEHCTPARHVFFLKTHKTASSSVQNIILRYANSRNLTFALPATNSHLFSLIEPFTRQQVKSLWGVAQFDILAHHLVYNMPEIEKIMPLDTLFVTIVRDPVSVFESLYEYEKYKETYNLNIADFARLTTNASAMLALNNVRKLPRHPLTKDFGFIGPVANASEIKLAVAEFDRRFDVVMLAEQFDESIVLLSHALCWNLTEMISFTNNARGSGYRNKLSDKTKRLLTEWNWADQILYTNFKNRFEDSVSQLTTPAEVSHLRQMRSDLYDACIDKEVLSSNSTDFKFWSNKIMAFKLKVKNNSTCENMVKPEKQFTAEIREKQMKRSYQFLKKFENKVGA